ncbi:MULTISPECIES: 2-oxoglutarate dehydrogenase complex dihydrolipoyllysine-residue succinyltransferase [Candidatus Ichthyocystis]|uniref:2-oxoglutarate dehydrogenase complex dihydrolipoyllysine-residue succinyltransferase n=1 Tax=Candidatus Ichthyocystis TaxID=2929841 RepID=UPI000A6EA91D|nr:MULTISPECIES: 2-oxoglutarate dehydrogenase complex dihydrolipoyllysine-residue succinyltransferase [Ichthyocystis]
MSVKVKVPQLSESVSEATLLSWQKQPGDHVKRGEVLVEIETDKIVMEIPSPIDGVLSAIIEDDGAIVVSGQDIADITEMSSDSDLPSRASAVGSHEDAVVQQHGGSSVASHSNVAMPAAVSLASNMGVDLGDVSGSGLGGRILKEDVLKSSDLPDTSTASTSSHAEESSTSVSVESESSSKPEATRDEKEVVSSVSDNAISDRREPMSRLRVRVAERLLESQSSTATLTTFNEVNMKAVIDLRKRYVDIFEKSHGVRLGFMSFFVKAVVAALKKFPVLNASIDGSDIIYHGSFNIGVAVGTERGLVVPVIRDADSLLMHEIELAISDYAKRAKSGRLALDDLLGGTFSISNGGSYGSVMSTPIINPPQSAILGVHAIKDRPVVENGEIVIRPMVHLALSYDHRLIDGREAVLGLVAIKDALEDPSRLLLCI